MNQRFSVPAFLVMLELCACVGGGEFPTAPDPGAADDAILSGGGDRAAVGSSCVVWALWTVEIDRESREVQVVPLRGVAFNCNVAHFLSPPVSPEHKMTIVILPGSDLGAGYVDVDIAFTHPFPGYYEYRGFDVRGIFMSDGSRVSQHDPAIRYASPESNEPYMLNPDGYTRWWNAPEFTDPFRLFSFKPAPLGNHPNPSAVLNPYRYFADDLAYDADVGELPVETRGVFSPDGAAHKRNYKIQFPVNGAPSYRFNYAVDASWEPPDESCAPDYPVECFPPGAQCREPYHIRADTSGSTAWYEAGNSGGVVHLEIEVFDWQAQTNPLGVPGEVCAIWVESPVLGEPVDILPMATTSPGSQSTSSVFSVDLADTYLNITSAGVFTMLGSVESADPTTYQPQIAGGESFTYPDGPLAAYFMCSVGVSGESGPLTLIQPNGGEVWIVGTSEDILWTGGDPIPNVTLEYSKDDFVGDSHTIAAMIPNDGYHKWDQIPSDPSDTVKVRVSDATDPDVYDVSDDYFTISDQCTFSDPIMFGEYVETDVVWSTGFHYMQVDASRIVGCRHASDGDSAFPWLAVYDESDFTLPVDMFQVPGWDYPYRPWCFEVDSTDRVFFFMEVDYPSDGSTFDSIYYIDWDGSGFVASSLVSFSIAPFLDTGEMGGKLWLDSGDDLYAVTTEGKMLKFDHTAGYAGQELFDLDGDPQYQQGKELDFLLAEEVNAFFIYTGYGQGQRAIHRVSYDGTIEATENDIFYGLAGFTKCGTITGGIGADGDCRLVVIDGHVMYEWATVRYDYALEQKSWVSFVPPTMMQPGNTVHFDDELTVRFNTDAWAPMQTKFVFFDTPSDW